jgi:hypothetical protein
VEVGVLTLNTPFLILPTKTITFLNFISSGPDIAEEVRHWLLTAGAQIQSWVNALRFVVKELVQE